jgi:hypothetical protein
MVTGAVWTNVEGDNKKELVITGQWMAAKIFTYSKKGFEEVKNTGLENLHGWWQSIASADVNGDGKQDLIIGNIGENFYLKPNTDSPVKLWVTDFDGNGTPDQFLTRTVNKKDVPVFLKREITDQFPGLKKDNLKNSDYATKAIQQLFKADVLKKAKTLQFNYCPSVVAINNGDGKFTVKPLPLMVQLSSVNAICTTDINGDAKPDLLLGGNMFGFPPQFGRLDASYGHVLVNNGKGDFNYLETKASGINLKGEVRDIKEITTRGRQAFLITQNDSVPVFYHLKK